MDEHLRIGDSERERAAASLGEHYAQGRLTAEEHGERLDRIWSARTRAELDPVFGDLPGPSGPVPVPTQTRRRGPGPLFLVLGVVIVLAALTKLPWLVVIPILVLVAVSRRRRQGHRCARPLDRTTGLDQFGGASRST